MMAAMINYADPDAVTELLTPTTSTVPDNLDRSLAEEQQKRETFAGIKESSFVQVPSEPAGLRKKWRPMSLLDLNSYHPAQLQFLFPHPKEDWNDPWFENLIHDLIVRIEDFSKAHFDGGICFPQDYKGSPWSEVSPEFVDFASRVARGDPLRDSWARLLVDKEERSCLVMGVLSMILEKNVFSELLFGCDDHAIKGGVSNSAALEMLDKNMLMDESECFPTRVEALSLM